MPDFLYVIQTLKQHKITFFLTSFLFKIKKQIKIVLHCKSVGGKDRFSLIFRDY